MPSASDGVTKSRASSSAKSISHLNVSRRTCRRFAEIHARCAVTGQPFVAVFTRQRANERFRLRDTRAGAESFVQESHRALSAAIMQRIQRALLGGCRAETQAPYQVTAPRKQDIQSDQLIWTNFACPCCRYQPNDVVKSTVILFNKCGEHVCAGRVQFEATLVAVEASPTGTQSNEKRIVSAP